jgi:hypothetical protein
LENVVSQARCRREAKSFGRNSMNEHRPLPVDPQVVQASVSERSEKSHRPKALDEKAGQFDQEGYIGAIIGIYEGAGG